MAQLWPAQSLKARNGLTNRELLNLRLPGGPGSVIHNKTQVAFRPPSEKVALPYIGERLAVGVPHPLSMGALESDVKASALHPCMDVLTTSSCTVCRDPRSRAKPNPPEPPKLADW